MALWLQADLSKGKKGRRAMDGMRDKKCALGATWCVGGAWPRALLLQGEPNWRAMQVGEHGEEPYRYCCLFYQ